MKSSAIRWLVVLGTISIAGVVAVQVYWFSKAFNTEEDIFNREVNTALYNVANQFFQIKDISEPAADPIKQLSTNYYVVMINNDIDANLLENLLRSEFEKRNVEADFEYGIYDCTTDKMVYGNYVSLTNNSENSSDHTLPKWENQNYYFGVQFPHKAAIITDRMGVWIFSSSVLFVVIVFFGYALVVILKQKRLSEIQKDFINNMTHEFKTPISTIALSTDVISQPEIIHQPDRLADYAAIIKKENLRLKKQVERVLQMAGSDKLALKKSPVDIDQLIRDAIKSSLSAFNYSDDIVTTHLASGSLEVDQLHLTNAIQNLIDNAIKYSSNKPEIRISSTCAERVYKIEITDKGIGVSEQEQKKIFDKFYRVSTGNVHDVKGFGLGLSYARQVIEAHGGRLSMESELGKGTTMIIELKNG